MESVPLLLYVDLVSYHRYLKEENGTIGDGYLVYEM